MMLQNLKSNPIRLSQNAVKFIGCIILETFCTYVSDFAIYAKMHICTRLKQKVTKLLGNAEKHKSGPKVSEKSMRILPITS